MSQFPALDAEPAPPSGRRRLSVGFIVVVVLAVLVLAAGAGWLLVSHTSSTSGASSSTSTVIVGYQTEVLGQYTVKGTQLVSYTSLGLVSGWPTPSPDGKLLLSGSGQLVTMDGAKPVSLSTTLYKALPSGDDVTNGFADGSAYVAVFDFGGTAVSLASTATGASHALGAATYAIGDPTAPALYVTTPVGQPVAEGDNTFQPNGQVERRGIGIATSVVATASDIASRLKLPATAKLSLDPVPDPTGRDVAIFVDARVGSADTYGLVVYTRGGTFVNAIPSIANTSVFWSPSGSTLYYQPAGGQARLQGWLPASATPSGAAIPLPADISEVIQCTWSPDGKQAMCGAIHTSSHTIGGWLLVEPGAHSAILLDQASNPVLWVKGGS